MEAKVFLAILGMMAVAGADYAPTGPYPQSGYPAANYATEPSTPEQGGPTGAAGFGGPGGFVGGPFFPPIVPPPPFALTPICAVIDTLKLKFLTIAQPVLSLGLGAFLFFMLKSLLLPKFGGHFGHLFNKKADHDDLIDRVSSDVARAISEGICTEKIACSLGMSARRIPGAKSIARVIANDVKEGKSFFNIMTKVASGEHNDCSEYLCLTKENSNFDNRK